MHLKRLRAPKNWQINRKERKFIARPMPGPHAINRCITLNLVLRMLKYAKTSKEIKEILNNKGILVDKIQRKDYRFPLGVMDVLEIPLLKAYFRILYNKDGNFIFKKIGKEESNYKLCKIIGKKILGKDKVQINLYDGRNILVKKDGYKVGDSVIVDLEKGEIKDHLKLDKGSKVYIIKGKYIAEIGIIETIIKTNLGKARIIFKSGDKKLETLMDYAFVVDKEFKL